MARNRLPTQPNSTPGEQALVTPANMPEVLLALQQQQSTQALNSECAQIRQEIGALKSQVTDLKTGQSDTATDLNGIRRTHHIALGIALAVSVLIGVIWFIVGSKVSTLLTMADERQISDLHDDAKGPPPAPKST